MTEAINYGGKKVVITGGLGFIGSSLAIELLRAGAQVAVVDNFLSDHGANWHNLQPVENHPALTVKTADFADRAIMEPLLREADVVFHLAGQVSHTLSLQNPLIDIEINIAKTAVLLEMMKALERRPALVYTGTRGQYGAQAKLPVSEDAPMSPKGIYELSNQTAERMIQIYAEVHKVPAILLRLTNIYGPRAQVKHPHFGVLNWFVRLAVEGKPITIMGSGTNKRDFVYIDDCVDAILRAGLRSDAHDGQVFNVGVDRPSTFAEAAELLKEIAGAQLKYVEFSKERAAQEVGDFYSDITKARKWLGWEPRVDLREGLALYYAWLKENFRFYA